MDFSEHGDEPSGTVIYWQLNETEESNEGGAYPS